MAAAIAPTIATSMLCIFPDFKSLGNSRTAAAPIIGVANKKENLTASSRDNPTNNPPVIADPVLESPGIKAKTCINPILVDCQN